MSPARRMKEAVLVAIGELAVRVFLPRFNRSRTSSHPFSEEELFAAFRVLLPMPLARIVARQAVYPRRRRRLRPEKRAEPAHPSAIPHENPDDGYVDFADDTLVLLSLLSPASAAKVEEYRSARRGPSAVPDPDEERLGMRRRQQLAPLVARRASAGD